MRHLKVHLLIVSINNWVWNLLLKGDGLENYFSSTKIWIVLPFHILNHISITVLKLFIKPGHLVKENINQFLSELKSLLSYSYCLKEWNNLSEEIRNIESANKFKKTILSFISRKVSSVFAIHDTEGIKQLNRFRLNFTHSNYHKFSHGFSDMIDLMCKCNVVRKLRQQFIISCNLYTSYKTELLHDIYGNNSSKENYPEENLLSTPLYGSQILIMIKIKIFWNKQLNIW